MSKQYRMSWVSPKTRVGDTGQYGRGVFATAPFSKGETIAVLGGHILPLEELSSLAEEAQDTAFQVSDDLICTYATVEELCIWDGSLGGDYFNHSCDPNAGFRGQIEIVAMRKIATGEQITFDYAMCLTARFGDMTCLCGATACRGKITGDDWKAPELQRRYRGYFQPYIERKIDRMLASGLSLNVERAA